MDEDHRIIRLTQGQVAKVSPSDFEWLNQWAWQAERDRFTGTFYARRTEQRHDKQRTIRMHRFILGEPASHVDHIDRDTLNNRRSNLRLATRQQNGFNRTRLANNKSGFKGVHLFNGRYVAQIRVFGKLQYLGRFDTAEMAHEAYMRQARTIAGEFARS